MSPEPVHHRPSDQELIHAIEAGDASAFEVLYRRHRDWAYRLSWRLCADEAMAQDVLQDAFLYLLGKFPGFVLQGRMTTFLYPVVRHLTLRALERSRRLVPGDRLLEDRPAVDDPDPDWRRAELSADLRQLSDEQRELVLMRFVDGFKLEEIATLLGIPLGTVKSRLHGIVRVLRRDRRLRERLRERLDI